MTTKADFSFAKSKDILITKSIAKQGMRTIKRERREEKVIHTPEGGSHQYLVNIG